MPNIQLDCAGAFALASPGSEPTLEEKFTLALGHWLRHAALPALMLNAWSEEVAPDIIGLAYAEQSPHNQNTPEIWIKVKPLFSGKRYAGLELFLKRGRVMIREYCNQLAAELEIDTPPTVEFDVEFQLGGGFSLITGNSWMSEMDISPDDDLVRMLQAAREYLRQRPSDGTMNGRVGNLENSVQLLIDAIAHDADLTELLEQG